MSISSLWQSFRHQMTQEMTLPDFKGRHVFIARIRIFLFLGVWVLFFLFFPFIWTQSPFVPLVFSLGFFITSLCYMQFIRSQKPLLSLIFLEIFADAVSQTSLVYVMGYDGWAPYFVYGFYIAGVGVLTGYVSAIVASVVVFVIYGALSAAVTSQALPAFDIAQSSVSWLQMGTLTPYLQLIFLSLVLSFIVYSVAILHRFLQSKEQELKKRNRQLMALNHIGSTIRGALPLGDVIQEVLRSVTQGLGFDLCLVALVDPKRKCLRLSVDRQDGLVQEFENHLGIELSQVVIPFASQDNSIFMAIRRNRVLVRNNFSELTFGFGPNIQMQTALNSQRALGFKKFVITPLVAEKKVVGALIGASREIYVEDSVIDALGFFANQAAMALESAQLINELEGKNQELIAANRAKSQFLTVMTHELRTPLNAVLGYTEAMQDGSLGEVTTEQKSSLSEVLRNGHHLLDLINSILDLAKLESGKMELNTDFFDLKDLIEDVRASLMSLIDKKQHQLVLHIQDSIPLIKADPMKIKQVLVNLIGNSIKFTDDNGVIDVFVEHHSDVSELCQTDFHAHNVPAVVRGGAGFLVRVRDSGVGISKKDLPHVFDLFKQADFSHTRGHEGTGLGLALTKQLVILHSGFIVIESEPGRGTEVKVLLPQPESKSSYAETA